MPEARQHLLGLAFAHGQQAALELIASGAPLEQVLDHIIATIEEQAPGMRGSVLTLPDGRHLRSAAAPNLPADYCAIIDGIEIGPTVGSCGTSMFEDRRVVVTDIATDPLWADFRAITLPFGLRACWSTPLHASNGRVIGSFAMYYDEPRAPTARELELADVASHLCGLAVENALAAEQLSRRAAEQTAVAHISQRALSGGELDALSDELVKSVSSTLDGAPAALFEFDEDGDGRLRAAHGWPAGLGTTGEGVVTVDVPGPLTAWGAIAVLPGATRAGDEGGFVFLHALANVLAAGIERSRAEEQIRHQALHDPLTGLPNRTLLIGLLEHVLERERRGGGAVAVLLVDLDNFKQINDSHGHSAGDAVLAQLAPRMHGVVRESDTVGRFGGDEFVVVAEDVEDELGAVRLAERLLDQFRLPFDVDGRAFRLNASIGISLARGGAGIAESLLRDADAAMYRAKAQGGGGYQLFDEAMRERTVARKRLVGALQDALDHTNFQLDYQRVVSLLDRAPVGSEALLRWPGAPTEAPGPANFVPAAEDSGLIMPIGAWVLRSACGEAASWPNGGADRWVAVNISAQQLVAPGFPATVQAILDQHGLAPGRLMLDVTESVLSDDIPGTGAALDELARLGVLLALDDVGTGFASLHRILRLPIHVLKIDRAFVGALPDSAHARAVVAGVTAMAHELGKVVIAEGVETDAQLEAVTGLGCDFGQGYLFGRPGPVAELFSAVGGR